MRTMIAVLAFAFMADSAAAQQACPCIPVTHVWIAVACDSWDCVVSNVLAAQNKTDAVPMPTASSDFGWVVLRRITADSAAVSPDAPFRVDGYDSLPVAAAHFSAIDPALRPILLTAPDGSVLVVSRNSPEPRHHSAGR